MPVPLAGAAIAGAMGVVGGRLVKKQLETHNKMEKLNKETHTYKKLYRTSGGIKGSGGANVNPDYK